MSLYTALQKLRPEYQAIEIEKLVVPSCKTLLDLGCGANSNVKFFRDKIEHSVGMDIHKGDLEKSKKAKIHDRYILDDVMNVDRHCKENSFDAVISIGLVEHLKKKDSLLLMKKMEKIARKLVIIGTPNGFIPQEEYDNNPFQIHQSGFSNQDFQERGYTVLGMDGPKLLRGDNAKMRYKPVVLFSVITNILDPLLRSFPSICFNQLAYKRLNKDS